MMESIKKLLEGRGFFASFLTISGWIYVVLLIIYLAFQIILLIINEKEG